MLDEFTTETETPPSNPVVSEPAETDRIGIKAASFTWNLESDNVGLTPYSKRRNFKLQIEDEVFFKRGRINLIIGQTASGKTSLLMALLRKQLAIDD